MVIPELVQHLIKGFHMIPFLDMVAFSCRYLSPYRTLMVSKMSISTFVFYGYHRGLPKLHLIQSRVC